MEKEISCNLHYSESGSPTLNVLKKVHQPRTLNYNKNNANRFLNLKSINFKIL